MARTPNAGDNFPLSVVGNDETASNPEKDQLLDKVEDVVDTVTDTSALAEQLRQLKEQVQALQATTAELGSHAASAVASGARAAGSRVADSAVAAGNRVASGARATGEKVTETVETYPFSAMLVASVVAFVLGRVSAPYTPSFRSEGSMDQMKHRLQDMASRLPPHLRSALRSSLR